MTRRSTEQPQAVSSETDAAQVWLALLAEIIVEAVQKEALCANMNETLPPSEFSVEGEEGVGDEFLK